MSRTVASRFDSVLESLKKHRALGEAPLKEHEWLASHGAVRHFELNEVVTKSGQLAPAMLVVFAGHLVIRIDRGDGSHKVYEWHAGDVGGTMPYSRGAVPPADVVAEEPTRVLSIDKELLPELTQACPTVTATLVHLMLDRARSFKTNDLQNEKMVSLGKVAAGLAHELNNPAAAVIRNAKSLNESIADAAGATRRLGSLRLAEAQLEAMTNLRDACLTRTAVVMRSSIDRADHEDAVGDWLIEHGADGSYAAALAETPLTIADLDVLAGSLEGEALNVGLRWLAADCLMRSLATDIENAATRIRDLVDSIKGYSYMDRDFAIEPVDLKKGIYDTLALLAAGRREKNISLVVDLPDDLPHVPGVGGQLNQVWMNLVENAFDAVENGGKVLVSAVHEGEMVFIRIVDNGPGVPQKLQEHIFEPFFTTKGPGGGTGLGLDVVKRLLRGHGAGIDLESRPGFTEFLVRLPVRVN